jgi:ABC-type uncharacterized transport system involved in gliding motility auxiliary subunit
MQMKNSAIKFSTGLAGVILLLVILVAINVIIGGFNIRADLTEDKVFTLSKGTKEILKSLPEEVTIKLFVSTFGAMELPLKSYAQQVEDLLKEYQTASHGKVKLEVYNPKPDSEAEEWADRYGVASDVSPISGEKLFMGLVVVSGDSYATISFLDPRLEERLEYDISKTICRVANPTKPRIGVMSGLPVMGIQQFPYAMPGQPPPQNQPAWIAFHELKKDYEVQQIAMDTDSIDTNLDLLIVVHPKNISPKAQFAIDQYVLNGGKLLAFLDPLALSDKQRETQQFSMMPQAPFSTLDRLLVAWGITYNPHSVVADEGSTTQVRSETHIEDSPVFLSLREPNINHGEMVAASLSYLILPCAGAFSGEGTAGTKISPILVSTPQAALVNSMMVQMGSDAIRSSFKPELKKLNLAIKLSGTFKTAFPEGKPKDNDATETNNVEATPAHSLTASLKPTTIILVADADMLNDEYNMREMVLFGGFKTYQRLNENLDFFANAVEQLSGNTALNSIRTRSKIERPFEKVLELQREAATRWLNVERQLQEELNQTQERLKELQVQKDKNQRYILSPEQEETIKQFRLKQQEIERQLKEVRKNLREGIEELGIKVKVLNLALMPILVAIAGTVFAYYRRKQAFKGITEK